MSSPLPTAALGREARALVSQAARWCDGRFDPEVALPRGRIPPDGLHPERIHFVPQAAWYAFGLLARDEPGDQERADRVLDAVDGLQYRDPTLDEGRPWHGTFRRFAESPQPRDGAVPFHHFDPNWRQFLGTAFLLILAAFERRLPRSRVARLEASLALCVRGEPPERVHASYSNIALMRAFLEDEAGARLGERGWRERGEALARAVVERFDRHGAFEEYNSPTYYGIDLYALALWRRCASSERLREQGARLEAALWRDVARWYHPGLRNLCGPYSRTYGMDMRRTLGILGLWITLGLDLDAMAAPLPPITPGAPLEHGHDLFVTPAVAWLGARIPEDARALLRSFGTPRSVEQTLSIDEERVATGRLEAGFMLGGETCNVDRSAFEQYVPATLHWRLPDGEVGWLAVRAPGPSRARVEGGALRVEWPPATSGEGALLVVTLAAPGLVRDDFAPRAWRLPGLALGITHDLTGPEVDLRADGARACFRRADPTRRGTLEIVPQRP